MRRNWLDSIATMALIVACIAITAGAVEKMRSRTATHRPAYRAGDIFDLVTPESVQGAERTVAVVIQVDCAFCADSLGFYRTILAEGKRLASPSRLVIVSLDPAERARTYLRDHSVEPDAILPFPGSAPLRFEGTPTLAVLDQNRRIVGIWLGKLTALQEQEVRAAAFGHSGD